MLFLFLFGNGKAESAYLFAKFKVGAVRISDKSCAVEVKLSIGIDERLVNVNGNGSVNGAELVLQAEGVAKPVKVRYLFNSPWIGNVYSNWGIPIGPLMSDVK